MADAITGITETSATAAAIISSVAQEFLIQESKFMPLISDYSHLAVKGASSIKLPLAGGFTVGDKGENTAVDAQISAFTADTITIDQHRVIQFLVEDIAGQQASVEVVQEYLMRAMKGLALDIDEKILTELRLASASSPDHEIKFNDATNEDIEIVDILEARKLLQTQNLDPRELVLAIGPDQEKNMLQIEQFVDASRYGKDSAVLNGEIGMVYGCKVVVHSSIASEAVMFHKSAAGFALQMAPRVQRDYDLANLAWRYSVDFLGGFEVLDAGKRTVHITETA